MLYLIVNNDFHVENLLNQKDSLKGYDVCVIRIPYNLNNDCSLLSNNIITINSPYSNFKKHINPVLYYMAKLKVKKINFTVDDAVIILTEYDPINQYIAFTAKKKSSKVIILEEGIATYYNNISKTESNSTLPIKSRTKLYYLKYIIGFRFIESYENGFLKLKDKYIDDLVLYRNVRLKRDVEIRVVNSNSDKYLDLDKSKCIFLNQPLYQNFLSVDDYLEALESVFKELSKKFSHVYFKFHPRDSVEMKKQIMDKLYSLKNPPHIINDMNIDESINKYKPLYAISFFSDALFKLSLSGLEMIFLFNIFPLLREHPILKSLTLVLNDIECNLPKTFKKIKCEKTNGSKKNSMYLKDVIDTRT